MTKKEELSEALKSALWPMHITTAHCDIFEETFLKLFDIAEKPNGAQYDEAYSAEKLSLKLVISDKAAEDFVKNCNARFETLEAVLEEKPVALNGKNAREITMSCDSVIKNVMPLMETYWEKNKKEIAPYKLTFADSREFYRWQSWEMGADLWAHLDLLSDFIIAFVKEQSLKTRNAVKLFQQKSPITDGFNFPAINEDLSSIKRAEQKSESNDKYAFSFLLVNTTTQQAEAMIFFLNNLFPNFNCAKIIKNENNQIEISINFAFMLEEDIRKMIKQFYDSISTEQANAYVYAVNPDYPTLKEMADFCEAAVKTAVKATDLSEVDRRELKLFAKYLGELRNTKLMDDLDLGVYFIMFNMLKERESPTLKQIYDGIRFDPDTYEENKQRMKGLVAAKDAAKAALARNNEAKDDAPAALRK